MSDVPPLPETTAPEMKRFRRSKIITRPIRIMAEIAFAVVFLMAIATGGLMWRLSEGPIHLDSVLPTIQSELNGLSPGLSYHIEKAALEPGNRWRAFNVRLYGVTVGNQDKKPIGSLQEMVLGFSWRNFFNLTFIPSIIEIQRPTVHVTRFEDGHIGFNLQSTEAATPKAPMPELAHVMARTLPALREIRVTDAFIHYRDEKDPFSFDAKDGIFVLKRERNVVSGTLSLDVKAKEFEQKIRGTIQYDPGKEVTRFSVALKDLPPDRLADFLPQIPSEIQLNMPSNILLTATVDRAFVPVAVDMQITGKVGTLVYPPYYPEAIKLSDVLLNASYNLLDRSFDVSELYANLEKARLRAQASLKRSSDPAIPSKLEVLGLLENFPVNGLKSYWPQGLAKDARRWIVEHLRDGVVDRAGLNMHATIDKDNVLKIDDLGGKIKFQRMTVDYLPPMRPVINVAAEAQYDLTSFNIAVEKGELLKTQVEKADIAITGFDQDRQLIALNIDTTGPAQDIINVISSKPLEYPQKLGFSAGQFSGDASAQIQLSFPLINALTLNQVEMKTTAALTNLAVKNAVSDLTVSSKSIGIEVDTNGLSMAGDVVLADGSAAIKWQEFFGDEHPYKTVLAFDGSVTPNVLRGLRLPVKDYFTGSAATKLELKQDQKRTTTISLTSDLAKASMAIPELRAQKSIGSSGTLALNLVSTRGGATTLSDISASWPGFVLRDGTIRWNAASDLDTATLKGMTVGRSTMDVVVTPIGNNGIKAVLRGDILDLSGYWTAPKNPNEKPSTDTRRYDIDLRARQLYLDPEFPLSNVQAAVSLRGKELVTANVAADTADKGFIRLKQNILPTGGRQLNITAQNAGRVFQALDATDSVANGSLQVNGVSKKEKPAVIEGQAELKNFTVVKAPVLARIINAFSPGGLIELLNGRGLAFSKMSSVFVLESPDVIRLKNGRMTGASIGMSFQGRLYKDSQTINMSGTIVPVDGLNKMVGSIPLIGQILTGIKGDGLIAATYKIKGPTDNPQVSVNPLSALAPGILRSIFFESNDN